MPSDIAKKVRVDTSYVYMPHNLKTNEIVE